MKTHYELEKGVRECYLMAYGIHKDRVIAYTDGGNVVRCRDYEEIVDNQAFNSFCDSYLEDKIEIEK